MKSSIAKTIDAAFEKGKERGEVNLHYKDMKDSRFTYLLTKDTRKVVSLNVCTC